MSLMDQYDQALPDPYYQSEFYADVPLKRGLAWIVDMVLIGIVTLLIIPFTAFTALFFLPVLFLMVSFTYRVWSLAARSATPGMRLFAIEFRDRTGRKFDLATAFLHTLGYTLTIATLLLQVLSIGLMVSSARRQGLSDLVLGTVAINRPARM
jgi:uncharacterized RDD family membrane protein YckC